MRYSKHNCDPKFKLLWGLPLRRQIVSSVLERILLYLTKVSLVRHTSYLAVSNITRGSTMRSGRRSVFHWYCCFCGLGGTSLSSETCPECRVARCQNCPVYKVTSSPKALPPPRNWRRWKQCRLDQLRCYIVPQGENETTKHLDQWQFGRNLLC